MNHRTLILKLVRQFIYLAVLTLIVIAFWQVADVFKSATVQEYGIFESIQSVVLLLIAASFCIQACRNGAYRPILLCLGMLALAALIREQDSYFDNVIPLIGWSWCWLFPLSGLALLIRKRRSIGPAMHDFLNSNSFHMMLTAIIIIIPVAQCLGHRSFLVDMLGDQSVDSHLVRRIMEEPIELLGYIQIFLASIECAIELRRK